MKIVTKSSVVGAEGRVRFVSRSWPHQLAKSLLEARFVIVALKFARRVLEFVQLTQVADLVAYATLMKLRKEHGRLSEREEALWVASLHDEIPKRVLNTQVDAKTWDGIKRLK